MKAAAAAAERVARGLPDSFEARLRASGALSYAGGVKRRDCPLHPGSAARRYWQLGYDAAMRAAERNCLAGAVKPSTLAANSDAPNVGSRTEEPGAAR